MEIILKVLRMMAGDGGMETCGLVVDIVEDSIKCVSMNLREALSENDFHSHTACCFLISCHSLR